VTPSASGSPSTEPHRSSVQYPGGLAARYRWVGSQQAAAISATSEVGGRFADHGPLVSDDPDRLCRAELRIEGPLGAWTARLASTIFDEPQGVLWDTTGLLVVKYGFCAYAFVGRTGELRWTHATRTPLISIIASSRLHHVIAQSELETAALGQDGGVLWRVAHPDVIAEAELVGGSLVLTCYTGLLQSLDPQTGRAPS